MKTSCMISQQDLPSSITRYLRLLHDWQPKCAGVGAGFDVAASQGTGCGLRAGHAARLLPRDEQRRVAGSDDEGKG